MSHFLVTGLSIRFACYSWPKLLGTVRWGSALCMGFAFFRASVSSAAVIAVARQLVVKGGVLEDDQVAVNAALDVLGGSRAFLGESHGTNQVKREWNIWRYHYCNELEAINTCHQVVTTKSLADLIQDDIVPGTGLPSLRRERSATGPYWEWHTPQEPCRSRPAPTAPHLCYWRSSAAAVAVVQAHSDTIFSHPVTLASPLRITFLPMDAFLRECPQSDITGWATAPLIAHCLDRTQRLSKVCAAREQHLLLPILRLSLIPCHNTCAVGCACFVRVLSCYNTRNNAESFVEFCSLTFSSSVQHEQLSALGLFSVDKYNAPELPHATHHQSDTTFRGWVLAAAGQPDLLGVSMSDTLRSAEGVTCPTAVPRRFLTVAERTALPYGRPALLLSMPGSGNTYVRLLLEHSTGFFTGSLTDDQLLKVGR